MKNNTIPVWAIELTNEFPEMVEWLSLQPGIIDPLIILQDLSRNPNIIKKMGEEKASLLQTALEKATGKKLEDFKLKTK